MSLLGRRSVCPWCTQFNCRDCGYGERHGMCLTPKSKYTKILDRLPLASFRGVSYIPEVETLVIKTKNKFYKLERANGKQWIQTTTD